MSSSSHAFERPRKRSFEEIRQDLRDDAGYWGDPSDSDPDVEEAPEQQPGQQLVEHLLDLHMRNKISAKDTTTAMHWANKAGIAEAAAYALPPESASGHCSRKLKGAMGLAKSHDLYELQVPGQHKQDAARGTCLVWCLPAHEQLARDLEADAGLRTKVMELHRDRAFPAAYWGHPVVARHEGKAVAPVALYLDAVPWSQTDSVLGFWLICLVSGRRYLWGVLRKKHTCRCGCRGWCSFDPFFRLALWSVEALANGQYPGARHDGTAWLATDAARKARAGQQIRMPCACLYLKGDWSEFSNTVGLPSWQDGLRPCFLCNAFGPGMYTAAGNAHTALRWTENTVGDYSQACDQCTIVVVLSTEGQRKQVVENLRYDKRQQGSHGRALITGVPELNLQAHDRLEPSRDVPDVGELESLPLPITAVFWRPAAQTAARHRNPLLVQELGLDPTACLAVDVLHAVHLWVLKVWARVALWNMIESGVYGAFGNAEENIQRAVSACRVQLTQWYKRRHQENPTEGLTRLNDLTVKMLGTSMAPLLKTKGAETWGLALFLMYQYEQYRQRLGAQWQRLHRAGGCIVRVVNILQGYKGQWTIPDDLQKDHKGNASASILSAIFLSLSAFCIGTFRFLRAAWCTSLHEGCLHSLQPSFGCRLSMQRARRLQIPGLLMFPDFPNLLVFPSDISGGYGAVRAPRGTYDPF